MQINLMAVVPAYEAMFGTCTFVDYNIAYCFHQDFVIN